MADTTQPSPGPSVPGGRRQADGSATPAPEEAQESLRRERLSLLEQVSSALDGPMILLSAAWIALLVAELVVGLPRSLEVAVWVIWAIFVVDFLLEFTIAPLKLRYLRAQWLTVLSLVLPAFRIFRLAAGLRFLATLRFVRTVGLLRLVTSINRGLSSLRLTAARRGVPYVFAATALVLVVGGAGMAYFEAPGSLSIAGAARATSSPLHDYGDALWWTAYAMTTGAPGEAATSEGKLLGWLLSLYGLVIFGYLTATLASHFVGRDRMAYPGAPPMAMGGKEPHVPSPEETAPSPEP
jgi:voltage-gated potassium channel